MGTKTLHEIVSGHADAHTEASRRLAERTRSYPATFEEYTKLPQGERFGQAFYIFRHELPAAGYGRSGNRLGNDSFSFSVRHLVPDSGLDVNASVAYSDGNRSYELNSTHVRKYPHLKVTVSTPSPGHTESTYLADVEERTIYDRNAEPVSRDFRVLPEPGFGSRGRDYIYDEDNPFFREVAAIVDAGVGEVYSKIISPRIALGLMAINS